jgi:hypothetical protein
MLGETVKLTLIELEEDHWEFSFATIFGTNSNPIA